MKKLAESRLTSQGHVSVPAEVRRRLGLSPGSTLVWEDDAGTVVVRRSVAYSSSDIHKALFPEGPPQKRTDAELKEGLRTHIRKKHARR